MSKFERYSNRLKAIAANVGGMGGQVNYIDGNGKRCSESVIQLAYKVGRALIDDPSKMIVSEIDSAEIAKHENNLLFNMAMLKIKHDKEKKSDE